MIKQTINFSHFCDAFWDTYKNNFSYNGKKALFDYLEEYSESVWEDVDLDTVALCCDYTEYDTAWEAMEAYQSEDMPVVDLQEYSDTHNGEGMDLVEIQEEQEKMALEWLQERTIVIEVEGGGVIIANF